MGDAMGLVSGDFDCDMRLERENFLSLVFVGLDFGDDFRFEFVVVVVVVVGSLVP